MAVFLLIGKTSALTMNIGGVVKDWMLIGLSGAVGWGGGWGRCGVLRPDRTVAGQQDGISQMRTCNTTDTTCLTSPYPAQRPRPSPLLLSPAPASAAVWMYKAPVSALNLFGYGIAFVAFCGYNYRKLQVGQGRAGAQARGVGQPCSYSRG